jgi:hypothetical protein
VSKRVEGLLRSRDVASLSELGQFADSEYHESDDVYTTIALRQIASLFKKNDAFAEPDRCKQAAEESFLRGEKICRITNRRLDWFGTQEQRLPLDLSRWVRRMQQEIAFLLGDTSDWVDAMPTSIRLTNGATEDRSRRRSLPFLKITGKLRGPRTIVPYLGKLLLKYGVDLTSCAFTDVSRNVLAFVPKNWKTFRTIAKEATHCLPFQLSLDSFLKDKLKGWGINLASQARNQEFARMGSLDGTVATIDLAMASDTLSYNAVALLLPWPWFDLLCSFRSTCYAAPWGLGVYAKFSSMGNGYTFSLETLIFAAACRAVGSRRYAVYGDDIALETDLAPDLVRLLKFLGFKVNEEKSFMNRDSRFRESCGCDYYKGELITPFYLRECPREDDHAGMSHALNGLILASKVPGPLWTWASEEVRRLKLRLVPWNEDSRSGVWITPRAAWSSGKLYVDRRRPTPDRDNPGYGFPTFKGYGIAQIRRKARGWRSLFVWYLQNVLDERETSHTAKIRTADFLLSLNGLSREPEGCAPSVIDPVVRSRYVHKTRRFSPKPSLTPSHLFLWDEVVG